MNEQELAEQHERFKKHYPDGYRMEFVGYPTVKSHKGLSVAFAKNKDRRIVAERVEA